MEFIQINKDNLFLLQTFFSLNTFTTFRYFKSRPFDIIAQHKYTVLLKIKNELVGYAHIDFEDKYWLGLCIANGHEGKGYGKKLIQHIFQKAEELHIPLLHLAVDLKNTIAIQLYLKMGFYEISRSECCIKMEYQVKKDGIITLPVSFGEAFDKLSILDIKLQKIKDERVHDVQKEYNLIYKQLQPLFTRHIEYHYKILKHINQTIWDQQDEFRDCQDSAKRNVLCVEIIKENDRRFLVKHKINSLLQSALKEQKGYVRRKAVLLAHEESPNLIQAVGTVRFYATLYDKVFVYTTEDKKKELQETYADDPSIVVTTILEDNIEIIRTICSVQDASFYFHSANKQNKKAVLLTHLGLGDHITAIGMVRYFAEKYDQLLVVCKDFLHKNLVEFFRDDSRIAYIVLPMKKIKTEDILIALQFPYDKTTKSVTIHNEQYDYIRCGQYWENFRKLYHIPFVFYTDVGLTPRHFWDFFRIADTQESKELYNKVKEYEYVVLHASTSTTKQSRAEEMLQKRNIDKHTTLVLNTDENMYKETHPFYTIAQEFVLKQVAFYKDTLIHAKEILVTDSCIFCLAINLPLETDKCFVLARSGPVDTYNYLFTPENGFDETKTRRFLPLIDVRFSIEP